MTALELAKSLSAKFFAHGNYESPGGAGISGHGFMPAGADAIEEYFDDDHGFSGLAVHSVGFTEGADEEQVIIYVVKGSRKALRALPEEVEGVGVTAQVMGKLRAGPRAAAAVQGPSHFFQRGPRIACGSSCAPGVERYAGTFGAIIRRAAGALFALSNNHVFAACNHTPPGMPILAPATMDTRAGRAAPSEFARHEAMVELRSGDPDLVPCMTLDAAIAALSNPANVSSWQGDADGFDTPAAVLPLRSGLKVKKIGRTTGLTSGTVEAFTPTPWMLPYKTSRFTANVWFTNTWTVRSNDADPFALAGDSGSLLVTEDGQHAVGLLFAANTSGSYGIIMPIGDVLAAFGNATLLSGYGL